MQSKLWVCAIVCCLAFGAWPIFAGQSKLSPPWLLMIVGITLSITGILKFMAGPEQDLEFPALIPFCIGLLGAIVYCCGYWFYGTLIILSKKEATTFFVVFSMVSSVLVVFLGGVLFFGEQISLRKLFGIALVALGLFLVKMK